MKNTIKKAVSQSLYSSSSFFEDGARPSVSKLVNSRQHLPDGGAVFVMLYVEPKS